ncbi:hypothetical protein MXEN_01744 [Mycobacterium xenopi RIVM700367]|nr:hypothetical protein MXEN_01744 [Mycobacterium xenopi RIVM700367]
MDGARREQPSAVDELAVEVSGQALGLPFGQSEQWRGLPGGQPSVWLRLLFTTTGFMTRLGRTLDGGSESVEMSSQPGRYWCAGQSPVP